MAYDNTNTGILSRNERKQKDSHPDFTGTINIEGVEYWLSGWTKEGKAGGKMEGKRFFSLSLQPKDPPAGSTVQQQQQHRQQPAQQSVADLDDDIPF